MKRRDFVVGGAALCAGVSAGQAGGAQGEPSADGKTPSAREVLRELVAGNRRFVEGKSIHPRSDESWLKRLTKGQKPLVTILSCSDSRVPLELLFDQGFGDIFAIRVAGNVVTRYGIGSIEYAQHHLHTPLFMVLGHEGCGAVTAALLPNEQRAAEPKGVRELLDLVHTGKLDPAANEKDRVAAAVAANTKHSATLLRDLDEKEEGLKFQPSELLVAAVYEISTGRVKILQQWESLGAKRQPN